MYSKYSVSGEYVGTSGSLDAAIRKLHPKTKLRIQQGATAYLITEWLKGRPVLLSIGITPGKTAAGGDPCYDVYISGSSVNGDSKQLVDRLVAEAGISVMQELERNNLKLEGTTSPPLSPRVKRQIEEIVRHF